MIRDAQLMGCPAYMPGDVIQFSHGETKIDGYIIGIDVKYSDGKASDWLYLVKSAAGDAELPTMVVPETTITKAHYTQTRKIVKHFN